MTIEFDGLDARREAWATWRRELHARPEIAFQETATGDFVAARIEEFGLQVTRGLAGTGLVATLPGLDSSRAIAFRADLDALAIEETNTFAHRSATPGHMHACGHDGHIVMLLAAIECMAASPPAGTVHFIFQPAEEGAGGAARMIDEGLFERFPVEAVFAIHNHPSIPLGRFGVVTGPVMAAYDEFTVRISGRGGHAAMPHQADDVILAAAHFVSAAQSIVSRDVDPMQSAVLSITKITAGEARNALPSTALLEGSCRSFRPHERDVLARSLDRLGHGVAALFGVRVAVEMQQLYPPTVNPQEEADIVRRAIANHFGGGALLDVTPQPASEDFAYMLERCAGCYVLLGSGDPEHHHPVHHPAYDFNDAATPYGVRFWLALARTYFECRPSAIAPVA